MPKGPRGEKRPADVIGAAVKVMKIATKQTEDSLQVSDPAAVTRGRLGGRKGGKARAKNLSVTQRKKIAKRAAKIRWHRKD